MHDHSISLSIARKLQRIEQVLLPPVPEVLGELRQNRFKLPLLRQPLRSFAKCDLTVAGLKPHVGFSEATRVRKSRLKPEADSVATGQLGFDEVFYHDRIGVDARIHSTRCVRRLRLRVEPTEEFDHPLVNQRQYSQREIVVCHGNSLWKGDRPYNGRLQLVDSCLY